VEFTYIDLFSGCGGLSLGLESENGRLLLAVEKSPMAAQTFMHNLIKPMDDDSWRIYNEGPLTRQIQEKLLVAPVGDLLSQINTLKSFHGQVDLIAGGPPCQGFSLAGLRNPEDARNKLPGEFLQVVEAVQPKMVVIENVVGMRHKFNSSDKESTFEQLAIALSSTKPGYVVQKMQVNAMHYGAAQSRPRLLIVGVRIDVAFEKQIDSTEEIWFSKFTNELEGPVPALCPKPTIKSTHVATVADALSGLSVDKKSNYVNKLVSIPKKRTLRGVPANQEIRNHSETSKIRFFLYHLIEKYHLPNQLIKAFSDQEILDISYKEILSVVSFPVKNEGGVVLARNSEELFALFSKFRTRKHSQRVVALDKPAPTVVTAADDYIHPLYERVFSVRELARFQGFPDWFEFKSKATTGGLNRRHEVPQYSQVGNAVSPFLSAAIGKMVNQIVGD
jgi:DNA (cytosine-5)-methyltransferase 1